MPSDADALQVNCDLKLRPDARICDGFGEKKTKGLKPLKTCVADFGT